jgi:hypothetical protein
MIKQKELPMEMYGRPAWSRHFPADAAPSGALAVGMSAAVGLVTVVLGTTVLREYGLALFCAVPMCMGFLSPMVHGLGGRRRFGGMLLVNVLSQMVLFGSLIVLGIEGLGCLIMCAPLWFFCALLGTAVAFPIHEMIWRGWISPRGFPVAGLVLILGCPALMGAEHLAGKEPELVAVTTTLEIDAAPAAVWQSVLAFPELPPPEGWVFKLGAAYPRRAQIAGHGVGAVRRCVFSTGAFVEPITAWDEPRRLAFDVTECPPSMTEISPYANLHPAHLEGYFVSRRGEFRLVDLGNGRTRLEGTTWYENRMFPAAYWRLWSDAILHNIHRQVLAHIGRQAEAASRGPARTGGAE